MTKQEGYAKPMELYEAVPAAEHYRRFLETAGAEHAGRAAAVRARIAELSRTPE